MRYVSRLLAAFLAVAAISPNAIASEGALMLGYQAPQECPGRDQFWGQLWDRSARLQSMRSGELTISIDTRITGTDSRYVGRLLLVDSTGEVLQREVGGSTCAEVSTALALIAAVSLDALPTGWQPTLPAPQRHRKALKRLAIGPSLGIHEAVAPHAVPTLGLSATYRARQYVGSPELRIEALISLDRYQPVFDDATRTQNLGSTRFLWLSSRTTACPFQAQVGSTTFGPCAVIELGRLGGSGKTTLGGTKSEAGWWFAPGAVLNWSWLADPVWVRFAGGATLPVIRDTFRFNPEPVVFRPPSLGAIAQFELAWAFW